MNRSAFSDLLTNNSLANLLEHNYQSDNRIDFFDTLKTASTPKALNSAKLDDRAQSLAQEATLFDKKFPKSEYRRVILSEEGKLMDTVKLSDTLRDRFSGNIVFLIGSAYGIDENLKKSADLLLSLSPLTFTHDHARVIMAEQLYRVQMVMQNHPYHHR